jgi:hypothetical protein
MSTQEEAPQRGEGSIMGEKGIRQSWLEPNPGLKIPLDGGGLGGVQQAGDTGTIPPINPPLPPDPAPIGGDGPNPPANAGGGGGGGGAPQPSVRGPLSTPPLTPDLRPMPPMPPTPPMNPVDLHNSINNLVNDITNGTYKGTKYDADKAITEKYQQLSQAEQAAKDAGVTTTDANPLIQSDRDALEQAANVINGWPEPPPPAPSAGGK